MQQMQRISLLPLSLALLLVTFLHPVPILAQNENPSTKACYFPNGRRAEDYIACSNDATGHSACCKSSNTTSTTCFTSGLCFIETGYFERGACTDQSWNSDACPGPCRGFERSGQNIMACSDRGSSFCCATGSSTSCCADDNNFFTFNVGSVAYIDGEPVGNTRPSTSPSPTTGEPTSGPSATGEPEIVYETSPGIWAGLAAGTAIPTLIAIVFAFLYFRERRRRKNQGTILYSSSASQDPNMQYGYGYSPNGSQQDGGNAGFMRRLWPHGDSAFAPIPPKYVPPERRNENGQNAQAQQGHGHELPAENQRLEGLSELGPTSPSR